MMSIALVFAMALNEPAPAGPEQRTHVKNDCISNAIAMLHGDAGQIKEATRILVHLGAPAATPAVPRLIEIARDPDAADARHDAVWALILIAKDDCEALSAIIGCIEGNDDPHFLRLALDAAPRLLTAQAHPSVVARARTALLERLRTCEARLDGAQHSTDARNIALALKQVTQADPETLAAIAPWMLIIASDKAREKDANESIGGFRVSAIYADAVRYVLDWKSSEHPGKENGEILRLHASLERGGLTYQFVGVEPGEIVMRTAGRPCPPDATSLEQLTPQGQALVRAELQVRGDLMLHFHNFIACSW